MMPEDNVPALVLWTFFGLITVIYCLTVICG
jgi:hypothetical protein